ncbi:MAG TPA: hypothetical protein P5532_06265 [Planctomycetota bacterium]|nr:hypothetical protein [Planctomycetota bacterium]
MIKNYLALRDRQQGDAPSGERPNTEHPPQPLRELQAQWAKMLTRCYELYAEGKRCAHEEDALKRLNCPDCEHREVPGFCRANALLRRLVGLIADYLAERRVSGNAPAPQESACGPSPDAGDAEPPQPLTQAQLDDFKAQGICYEVETPLCKEHVWIVPKRTGKGRLELTCEEILFMNDAARTLEGTLVEIRRESPSKPQGDAK